MRLVGGLLFGLTACGAGNPVVHPAGDRYSTNEAAHSFAEIYALPLVRMSSAVDDAEVQKFALFNEAWASQFESPEALEESPLVDPLRGLSNDADSDGIPAYYRGSAENIIETPAGWERLGQMFLWDGDDEDVFGGFSVQLDGFGYQKSVAHRVTWDGTYSLKREEAKFFSLRVDLYSVRQFEEDVEDLSYRLQATLNPDDPLAPEKGGDVHWEDDSVWVEWRSSRGQRRVRLEAEGLHYSGRCLGSEHFDGGAWWFVEASGERHGLRYESDCTGQWF